MSITWKRAAIGIVGACCTVGLLVWSVGLGAAKSHIDLTAPKVGVADRTYMAQRASLAVSDTNTGRVLRTWTFDSGLPSGWEAAPGVQLANRDDSTVVSTNSNANDVQLHSPAVSLPRGVYRLLVDGAVSSGGLQVGVETTDGQSCSSADYFEAKSTSPGRSSLALPFVVDETGPVRVVLANWAQRSLSSLWQVRHIRVAAAPTRRVPTTAKYVAVASPLMPLTAATAGTPLFRWSLVNGLPSEWIAAPSVTTKTDRSGLVIRTARDHYGYQLTMALRLKPGSYLVWLDGRIVRGGLTLGAENLDTGRWLKTRSYWYGQSQSPGVIGTPFTIHRQTTVELVLANWSPKISRSVWHLRGIEIDQLF
jgi:hypothetical protein